MAARFWRITGLETWGGGDLALSDLQLFDGAGRVDAPAAITCSHPPVAGNLVDLQDGLTTAEVRWTRAQYSAGGFWLQWDFGGAPVDVVRLKLGAGAEQATYASGLLLQGSDSGAPWLGEASFGKLPYPGAWALSALAKPSPNKRFWRVYITANNGDAYTSVQEIELRTTQGGVDVTTPASPAGQSSFSISGVPYDGAAVFNNEFSSAAAVVWVTAGATNPPHWVSVDLAIPMRVVEIAIWSQNFTQGPARAPKDFEVQGSDDGVVWQTVSTHTAQTGWVAGTPKVFSVASIEGLEPPSLSSPRVQPHTFANDPIVGSVTGVSLPPLSAIDLEDGGAFRVAGTTKEVALPANTPLSRRVRLHNERDGRLVREVWSDQAGNYSFDEIAGNRKYTVIASDHTDTYRAVIADKLDPEAMP